MNIGMILDNEFTGDLRVENEVTSLQKAGHKVFVLCLNFGNKHEIEYYRGAKIIRIYLPLMIKNKLKGLNNTIFNFYPMFWGYHIKKFIAKYSIEVLHVHDLWMLESAYRGNSNLPVIADLHENFVHALKGYKYVNTFPGKYLISIKRWQKKEIEWTKKANVIITVIEEAVARYKELGNPEDKIVVIPNYVNFESFLDYPKDEEIIKKFKEYFNLVYVGGFDLHRGIEIVLKATSHVIKQIKDIKLILVGNGSNYSDLVEMANKLGISDHVSFEGWQSSEKLPSYIESSHICLIPHLKSVQTDNTIPHKLFQYMLMGKPVLASNCNPLVRIINESNSGLIYKDKDDHELAQNIIQLYNNSSLRKKLGENGRSAVMNKYNWNVVEKELIRIYEEI